MTLKFNAASRISKSKVHKIVIEMFKNVDINNEVFREEDEIQESLMVWPYKSNGKNNVQGKA
jgi:hypothetical protein